MIGYATVGTNDLQRAMAFYDALFGSVGISRLLELPHLAGWGVSWSKPMFGVVKPFDGRPASPGNGAMIAMGQRTREKVRRHRRGRAWRARCRWQPGLLCRLCARSGWQQAVLLLRRAGGGRGRRQRVPPGRRALNASVSTRAEFCGPSSACLC